MVKSLLLDTFLPLHNVYHHIAQPKGRIIVLQHIFIWTNNKVMWIFSSTCNSAFSSVQHIGKNDSWSSLKLIKAHSHRHKNKRTFFSEPVPYKPPACVYLYGWAPGCDQQTQSWTARHPLRCPCFPPIHSSITSKAPSAAGFYTNTCSLIYNSQ